jgi:hypothetical protein
VPPGRKSIKQPNAVLQLCGAFGLSFIHADMLRLVNSDPLLTKRASDSAQEFNLEPSRPNAVRKPVTVRDLPRRYPEAFFEVLKSS